MGSVVHIGFSGGVLRRAKETANRETMIVGIQLVAASTELPVLALRPSAHEPLGAGLPIDRPDKHRRARRLGTPDHGQGLVPVRILAVVVAEIELKPHRPTFGGRHLFDRFAREGGECLFMPLHLQRSGNLHLPIRVKRAQPTAWTEDNWRV